MDIGLRHPRLFGTVESWSGYFTSPHDGSLRHADSRVLAAHDPTTLVRAEAPVLRRFHTRFFLSCGTDDVGTIAHSTTFAAILSELHLSNGTFFRSGRHNGRFWEEQLPAALVYAFAAP